METADIEPARTRPRIAARIPLTTRTTNPKSKCTVLSGRHGAVIKAQTPAGAAKKPETVQSQYSNAIKDKAEARYRQYMKAKRHDEDRKRTNSCSFTGENHNDSTSSVSVAPSAAGTEKRLNRTKSDNDDTATESERLHGSRMMTPRSANIVFRKYESELHSLTANFPHDSLAYSEVSEILQAFYNSITDQ